MVAQGKLNLPLWLSTTTTTSYMEKLAYFAISVKITYGSASTARPITIARFAISKLISLPSNRLCIAQNPCSSIVMTFVCRKIGENQKLRDLFKLDEIKNTMYVHSMLLVVILLLPKADFSIKEKRTLLS